MFNFFISEKARRIVKISYVIFALSLFFSFLLFKNVRPEIEYLLPKNSPNLKGLQISRERYPSTDMQLLFVSGENSKEVETFTSNLKTRLEVEKHPAIKKVISEFTEEINFYSKHQLAFASLDEWKNLKSKISYEETLKELKQRSKQAKALNQLQDLKAKFKKLIDLKRLQMFGGFKQLPGGELVSSDGKVRLLIIIHSSPMTNLELAKSFDSYLNALLDGVKKTVSDKVEIKTSGIAKALVEEYKSLWNDLAISVSFTLILIMALVWVFFKEVRLIGALFYVLIAGTLAGFSITFFLFRNINTNSAFLCSVIIGNSINSGIIFISYYIHALKDHFDDKSKALASAYRQSFWPTLMGMMTSAVAFGSLMFNSFRGFFDFGLIGLIGMIIGWLYMLYLLPSLLSLPYFSLDKKFVDNYSVPFSSIWKKASSFIVDKRYVFLGLVLFIVSIGALSVWKSGWYRPDIYLERDMTKLKDESYNSRKFSTLQPYLQKVFLRRELVPAMLMLGNNEREAYELRKAIGSDLKLRVLIPELRIFSLSDLIPYDQGEKEQYFEYIRKLPNLKEAKAYPNVSKREETLIDEIISLNASHSNFPKTTSENIPKHLKDFFTESDGSIGRMIFLNFNLNVLERDLFKVIAALERIHKVARETVGENEYVLSGIIPALGEIGNLFIKDSWKSVVFTLLVIQILFIVVYRDPKKIILVTTYFTLTMLFFMVMIPILGIKINVLNFVAIPLTLGIGVDYSSNIIHSVFYERFEKDNLKSALNLTGPFIMMASLTTIIGYISLVLSTRQLAVYSFGKLCLIGEIVTLSCALMLFPSLYCLFFGAKSK